jgi:hypothetical protein
MKFQFASQGLKELMVALIIVDEDDREGREPCIGWLLVMLKVWLVGNSKVC